MKVNKIGHSCLLVEDGATRILVDPGVYFKVQNDLNDIDIILITHEHPDHCDLNSLKTMLINNPKAKIFTNKGTGAKLKAEGIPYSLLESKGSISEKGVTIEAFGEKHAVLHESIPVVENTCYMISSRLFCPGDSFTIPDKSIEILALPVSAPWLKFSEAVEYAKFIRPKVCIPIHDGFIKEGITLPSSLYLPKIMESNGIKLIPMKPGDSVDLG